METFLMVIAVLFWGMVLCRFLVARKHSKDVSDYLKKKRHSGDQDLGSTDLRLNIRDQKELEELFKNKRR